MFSIDRTVYYNTESCSTVSEDSYQESPVITARVQTSRGGQRVNTGNNSAYQSWQAQQQRSRAGQQHSGRVVQGKLNAAGVPEEQQFYSASKCSRGPGPSARHIFHRKIGGNAGITRRILHAGISRVAVHCHKDREDIEFQYGTVLVLHLQCKNIYIMTPGILDPFVNLKNLYLYKNNIRRIQGLDALINLELLDLSRNNVERIDNLEKCRKLKQLYLGFNEIQVIEGLEGLNTLQELLVDDQDMPPGQAILFSPGIMASVAHCLRILDISSNQLETLDPIANLPVLHTLLAGNNRLSDFPTVLDTLESLRQLRFLTLKGNPMAKKPHYKSKVIGSVYRLETLDDKEINDTTRACVQKLRLIKEYRTQLQEERKQMNQAKKAAEEEQTKGFHLDLGNPGDFTFSTPTRLSPLPPPKARTSRKAQVPQGVNSQGSSAPNVSDNDETPRNVMIDNSSYESRARNVTDDDAFLLDSMGGEESQMSDMAKIIFRLSNLDEAAGPGGDGGNVAKIKYANYWESPGSSVSRECRPLSPLEDDATMPGFSASVPEMMGHTERKTVSSSRPKPAAPGGRRCSNNASKMGGATASLSNFTVSTNNASGGGGGGYHFQSNRHFHGRTLSPLIEMPTPESLTARDETNAP